MIRMGFGLRARVSKMKLLDRYQSENDSASTRENWGLVSATPPFLCKACQDPLRLYDWYAQLQRSLVLNPWTRDANSPPTRLSGRGSRGRRCAHEVGCINLDLIAPARAYHL